MSKLLIKVKVFSELTQCNRLSSYNTGSEERVSRKSLEDMVRSSGELLITVSVALVVNEPAVHQLQ